MPRLEVRDRRLRLDRERRIERHRPWRRAERHHLGDVGAPQDVIGHEIVGGLGGVIDANDRDQRARAFRRLEGRERGGGLCRRDRRRGAGGRCWRQREQPGHAARREQGGNAHTTP
jgi:hypothetical protein